MSLDNKIIELAEAIGLDIKTIYANQGDLNSLSTTAKSNLVVAINELHTLVNNNNGLTIDDTATTGNTTKVWSVNKIIESINAAKEDIKTQLTDGASAALDTFSELAAAMDNDPNFAATLATTISKRVRYDTVQVLSEAEKLQACRNIGVGDITHNFVADYNAAKTGI